MLSPSRFPSMAAAKVAPWLLALACGGCAGAGAQHAAAPAADSSNSVSDADQFLERGKRALAQGDSIRAEQYLSLALEHGAERRVVVPLLLRVCLTNSRLRAALNYAEPYLRDHPENDALRYLVATIRLSLGQESDARKELQLLAYRSPRFADTYYLLGALDFQRADSERAKLSFEKYMELAPEGEHAPEVRSRLSEISAREELAKRDTLPTPEFRAVHEPNDAVPVHAEEAQ